MLPGIRPLQSLNTRITLTTLAIFLIGIWSLSIFASRMLRTDMARLLGEQQYSTVSYMAAEINNQVADRIKALVGQMLAGVEPKLTGTQLKFG